MKKSKEEILRLCARMCENTLMETLNIEFVDVDELTITARMPVTSKVHQPDGVLHGGATVALAESVGSAAAFLFLGSKDIQVRGIEISANHVKSVREGFVYANARLVHHGRTTQLWHIDIKNEQNELISFIKLTTLTLNQ